MRRWEVVIFLFELDMAEVVTIHLEDDASLLPIHHNIYLVLSHYCFTLLYVLVLNQL
jgi:hypothetical protein